MNSKNLKLISFILSFTFLTSILMSFTANIGVQHPEVNPNLDDDNFMDELEPLLSDTSNNDPIILAEKAARVLRNEWLDNNWNESGTIYLGQRGVAGIGELFIELHRKTSNSTILNWASDIGDWLIDKKNIDFSNYPAGKWPDRVSGDILNYTGYYQGAAGIGSFFINLYNASNDNTYLNVAQDIDSYLSNIAQSAPGGNGLAWKEKDEKVLDDALALPTRSLIDNGTIVPGTKLSNLYEYNSSTYNIKDNATGGTEVRYNLNLLEAGIPPEDLIIASEFLSFLEVKISVSSNVTLDTSGIYIYTNNNNSWTPIQEDGITTTEQEYSKTINSNFGDFVGSGVVNIKINSTGATEHEIRINALNATFDYDNSYNSTSFSFGAAGIGDFYLDMNKYSGSSYVSEAINAGDYILYRENRVNERSAWVEKGRYYLGKRYGTAGIGEYLLRLRQVDGSATTDPHLEGAERAANWLIESGSTELIGSTTVLKFPETNETGNNKYITGIDYNAGIGQLLLDLGIQLSNDNLIGNATLSANWLTSNDIVTTYDSFGLGSNIDNLYYQWQDANDEIEGFFYSRGGSGALEFLDNIFLENESNRYGKHLSGGIEWLLNEMPITQSYWNGNVTNNRRYNLYNGLAGVGYALLTIDTQRPEITAYVPSWFEYDEPYQLYFEIENYSSNLNFEDDGVQLFYRYGSTYGSKPLTKYAGNIYNVTLPRRSWGQIYYCALVARDNNDTYSYDNNNGQDYGIYIVDTVGLDVKIEKLFDGGLGIGKSGKIRISVAQSDIRGAGLNYVEVNIPKLDISGDQIQNSSFSSSGDYLIYDYIIETGEDVKYGDDIEIEVISYDAAANEISETETFTISDNIFPTCNVQEDFEDAYSQWVPQFTSVELQARVYDSGSGLDDEEGVFVLYSTNDGGSWNKVYLERESGNLFSGEISGQLLLVNVYYVLGAEDKAGNYRLWDKFGTEYNDIADIDLEAAWRYGVTVNVWFILIFIAIVGGIGVGAYLIYSRRGDYLSQMRRKSKATATGLAIKERLTKFYYWAVEKMDNLGQRMVGSGDRLYKVRMWFEDHLGERAGNVLKTVGRVLLAVPLGIAHGISYFFKGIGRIIVKSKAWQLILYLVIGLAILLTTVIQFVMEGRYPLRAVFFTNLGFGMFISGIIIFLIRFIYKLTYK